MTSCLQGVGTACGDGTHRKVGRDYGSRWLPVLSAPTWLPSPPRLTLSCCLTISSRPFVLATSSRHRRRAPCCCLWARWSSTSSFS